MNSPLLLHAAALFLFSVMDATARTYAYDLTGEQFVQWMTHAEQLSETDFRSREKAYSYLDGVKDVSIGTSWCPDKPRKTFELAYDAADYIKGLPAQARNGNAAPLLLSFLSSRYPCSKGVRP